MACSCGVAPIWASCAPVSSSCSVMRSRPAFLQAVSACLCGRSGRKGRVGDSPKTRASTEASDCRGCSEQVVPQRRRDPRGAAGTEVFPLRRDSFRVGPSPGAGCSHTPVPFCVSPRPSQSGGECKPPHRLDLACLLGLGICLAKLSRQSLCSVARGIRLVPSHEAKGWRHKTSPDLSGRGGVPNPSRERRPLPPGPSSLSQRKGCVKWPKGRCGTRSSFRPRPQRYPRREKPSRNSLPLTAPTGRRSRWRCPRPWLMPSLTRVEQVRLDNSIELSILVAASDEQRTVARWAKPAQRTL